MKPRNGAPDRRRHQRGAGGAEPTRSHLVSMILGTFREMPGLCLHTNQAARLFGLKQTTCSIVMEDLVSQGKLRRSPDGQYVGGHHDRTISAPSPPPSHHVGSRRGR